MALKGRAAAAAFLFSIIASSIRRGSGRVSLPERSDKAQSRQQPQQQQQLKKKKKKEKMRHVSGETMYISLCR